MLGRREFLRSAMVAAVTPVVLRHRWAAAEFAPWLELDAAALAANVRTVGRLAGGRPIIAVIKHNAYGTGLARAAPIIAAQPEVAALAVVKASEAVTALEAGVRKPILLMALVDGAEALDLVRRG
ncbi:MAG TPA: alanine racemase, partial [Longimicrobiales bacterium]|nr:alanine racemase [Longimicrobiales bacterium]